MCFRKGKTNYLPNKRYLTVSQEAVEEFTANLKTLSEIDIEDLESADNEVTCEQIYKTYEVSKLMMSISSKCIFIYLDIGFVKSVMFNVLYRFIRSY